MYRGRGRGGERRGGFESSSGRTNASTSSVSPITSNPIGNGPVRILQSKIRRAEDEPTNLPVPSILKSLTTNPPRIAFRTDKSRTENEDNVTGNPTQPLASSIRLFEDYPHNTLTRGFLDYLMSGSSNFHVVGIVGSQGSGRSTFASMLGGNEPGDMYGEYIFRPSPREFVEKGASQTLSINVYVSKMRMIIFDCQAINSGHLLEYMIRGVKRESKHHLAKLPDEEYDQDTQRYLMLLLEICHTVILGIDWFLDINLVRTLMASQLMTQQLSSQRKVNLVVAQIRAKSVDFHPREISNRSKILRGIFENSKFDIFGGLSMKSLGFDLYGKADQQINYVVFAEIKPRMKSEIGMSEEHFGSLVIPFSDMMDKFRYALLNLPKKEFEISSGKISPITEKDWFVSVVTPIWEKLLSTDCSISRR